MLTAGAAVALLTLTGCAGSGGSDDAQEKVPATATGSLEDLAADVKCKPNIQTDADEIRQAICNNSDGKFVLATFATDRGSVTGSTTPRTTAASILVGRKWVAVGDDGVVERCAARWAAMWRSARTTTPTRGTAAEPRGGGHTEGRWRDLPPPAFFSRSPGH